MADLQAAIGEAGRKALEGLVRAGNTPQKIVRRAQIALLIQEGCSNSEISRRLGINRKTVILWRSRIEGAVAAGWETGNPAAPLANRRPQSGSKRVLTPELVERIVHATLHDKPAGRTHWTTRSLSKHLGVSKMAVQRVWKQQRLQPHRRETFKLSKDERFLEKLQDVVGVYLNPPPNSVVYCVDEKSQIQALDRTQPVWSAKTSSAACGSSL